MQQFVVALLNSRTWPRSAMQTAFCLRKKSFRFSLFLIFLIILIAMVAFQRCLESEFAFSEKPSNGLHVPENLVHVGAVLNGRLFDGRRSIRSRSPMKFAKCPCVRQCGEEFRSRRCSFRAFRKDRKGCLKIVGDRRRSTLSVESSEIQ